MTVDRDRITRSHRTPRLNVFLAENVVLAAGGPGELYETSVYPRGQIGIHGLALQAGLAAENLTESQFGLASTKFRWNVSGTYMQVVPRIFCTDADGGARARVPRRLLPVDEDDGHRHLPQGLPVAVRPAEDREPESSLIDVLVYNERQKGRRVFLDFRQNPIGTRSMQPFDLDELEPEAFDYLQDAGALQKTPIERLAHMNPPGHRDLHRERHRPAQEPLEIAVCAQHNNGGFAVNKWWESSIPHTFVIGEMAGTHGVKRPGGSALNAGQVGGLRAAEYIANVYGGIRPSLPQANDPRSTGKSRTLIDKLRPLEPVGGPGRRRRSLRRSRRG